MVGVGAVRGLALLGVAVVFGASPVLGCSSPGGAAASANVSGNWCGASVDAATACTGDSVVYVELAQTGSSVTGTACEYYRSGCSTIENGTVLSNRLTYYYTFGPDSVTADFTVAADGRSMTGTYASTKCGCQIAETLYLLP
jgi:hypothetical protein